ncbi:MAG: (2Fe-2S) ferredoxin domain-containing protein [bacterium]|nr:(2Fe-2S) ferredoxin domain-containing protein [bacterium]MCP4800693.1 (2Fe-2S) ferredoxin domain-containing protein [bacterium]
MRDLVVCVGETCHLSGAELVIKNFMELVKKYGLENEIAIKASFCIGSCCECDEVSVKLGDRIFQVNPEQSFAAFNQEVLQSLTSQSEV